MLASVIIPVYMRVDWLEKSLNALRKQTSSSSWEVIVVDDGSSNGAQIRHIIERMAVDTPFPLILLQKENTGPAAARNFGANRARGTILCFLYDDSVPTPRWLEEITVPFQKTEKVGLVSGKTLSYERSEYRPLLLERAISPFKVVLLSFSFSNNPGNGLRLGRAFSTSTGCSPKRSMTKLASAESREPTKCIPPIPGRR
jgi:glycosyltransferase involved in cell wall biosynthesis